MHLRKLQMYGLQLQVCLGEFIDQKIPHSHHAIALLLRADVTGRARWLLLQHLLVLKISP